MISYHFPAIVISCYCGIEKNEQEYVQNLEIELTIELQKMPEDINSLEDTINYAEFLSKFIAAFDKKHFPLLEDIAREISTFCRTRYPFLNRVAYRISKKLPLYACKTIVLQGEKTL